jgi:hypothetical protein
MEIKGDLDIRRPPKILGAPSNQNLGKYREFYEANGHYTEDCIALRQLIEKFIKNEKLARFLGKQRREAAPERTYVRKVNYHN